MEAQLLQRLTPELYVGALRTASTRRRARTSSRRSPPDDGTLRVADSDLAPLDSQTFGGKVVLDLPMTGARSAHCTWSSSASATSAPTTCR